MERPSDRTICMMAVDPCLIKIKREYYERVQRVGALMVNAYPCHSQGDGGHDMLASLLGGACQGSNAGPGELSGWQ